MNTSNDTIILDILSLDPELASRESEIRDIVALFVGAKPTVEIDGVFLNRLRAHIVKRPVEGSIPSPWFQAFIIRLAPVSAIALLVLILAPSFLTRPNEVGDSLMSVQEVSLETSAPLSAKRAAEGPTADMFSMTSIENENVQEESFAIGPQMPGTIVHVDFVSLHEWGFIGIHENADGVLGILVGTSTLLAPGVTKEISVSLTRPSRVGETYFGIAYKDNGDGVFDVSGDVPITDASNVSPLTTLFSIESSIPLNRQ